MLKLVEDWQTIAEGVNLEFLPILKTKLEPPRLPDGLIRRPHLLGSMNRSLQRPLTLVHAPAGFGKSSLVQQWLEEPAMPPVAWLWLDEDDNELERFVAYIVASVQTVFTDSCSRTHSLLQQTHTIDLPLLARTLINDLSDIPQQFILVLEEYEAIHSQAIHYFLRQVVENQPPNLHLVVVTRVIPPLPLARLRQRRFLYEISADDLRLSIRETAEILAQSATGKVDETEVAALHERTRGWVGGLHMATTAQDTNRLIREFFVSEVLAYQAHDIKELLLESSLLDRFCPDLLAHVCNVTPSSLAARAAVELLNDASLFVEYLDSKEGWYRYHPLFQATLRQELAQQRDDVKIANLHRRAAAWLEVNGEIDAALNHWIAAGELQAAADLVEKQVPEALATEAIPDLIRWLKQLPSDLIQQREVLLLAVTWVQKSRMIFHDIEPQLNLVENLLEKRNGSASPTVAGVAAALFSNFWYQQGHGERSLRAAEDARTLLPDVDTYYGAYVLGQSALSWHLVGLEDQALGELTSALQRSGLAPGARAQLLLACTLVQLNSGCLYEAKRTASTLARLAMEKHLPGSGSWANYLLGRIYYEWNQPEEARKHFQAVVDDADSADGLPLHDSYFGLVLLSERKEQAKTADTLLAALADQMWERGMLLLPEVTSFRARLALQQGDTMAAARQLEKWDVEQNGYGLLPLEVPGLTRVLVLIKEKTTASLKEALSTLDALQRVGQTTNNRWRMVEILVLRSLVLTELGQTETALDMLQQALDIGERGGIVRVFVDHGPPLAALLYRLAPAHRYARKLLAAYPRTPQPALLMAEAEEESLESLTGREWEILTLIHQGLSNKEIAQQLIISYHTVKKHASNMYQKLDVKNRRQAITRARELGLLAASSMGNPFRHTIHEI